MAAASMKPMPGSARIARAESVNSDGLVMPAAVMSSGLSTVAKDGSVAFSAAMVSGAKSGSGRPMSSARSRPTPRNAPEFDRMARPPVVGRGLRASIAQTSNISSSPSTSTTPARSTKARITA